MKAFKFVLSATVLVTVAQALNASPEATTLPDFAKIIGSWDEKDLKQFLADRNIKYDVPTPTDKKKGTVEAADEMKKTAAAELGKLYDAGNKYESAFIDQADSLKDTLIDAKETVLSYVWPNYISEKVSRSYSYITDQLNPSGNSWFGGSTSVSDWVFDSWSEAQLKATLKKNKISYKSKATKSDLVSLAKKNYNKISSNNNATGKYPGDWLFEAWAVKDLHDWLHAHHVSVNKKMSNDREYLLKQVRENVYPASVAMKDSKDEFFDSLNLDEQKSLVDHTDGVKEEFINKWSESQLREWLAFHGIVAPNSKKQELVKAVKENKHSLKADIDEWIKYAKGKTSVVIDEKIPQKKEEADGFVNDTFTIDVEKWPRDRLKQFLSARGVAIPLFATRKDLVKLVRKYKSKRLMDFSKLHPDVLFEGWSTEQIKSWLETNKVEAEGMREDLVNKASDLYKKLAKEHFYTPQMIAAATVAKDTVVDYSTKGKDAAAKAYDDYKDPVGDALNTAKDTAIKGKDAAAKAYDDYKDPVGDALITAKDKAYDAGVAAVNYGSEFYNYMSKWSNEELQDYLKTFGYKDTKSWSHDKLYAKAKGNTMMFFNNDYLSTNKKKSMLSVDYWKDLYNHGIRG